VAPLEPVVGISAEVPGQVVVATDEPLGGALDAPAEQRAPDATPAVCRFDLAEDERALLAGRRRLVPDPHPAGERAVDLRHARVLGQVDERHVDALAELVEREHLLDPVVGATAVDQVAERRQVAVARRAELDAGHAAA
jgi:hypothetical protein